MSDNAGRCEWCGTDPLYVHYHDTEWGIPLRDDQALFERICLEGAQAGLSWITILRKRDNYRAAFDGFDPLKVAEYDGDRIEALMANAGIVRNRLKIQATIHNARCFLDLQAELGSFSDYLWAYVDGQPVQNAWPSLAHIPAETPVSLLLSKDLKRRGFKFVGPTICYAVMQACGLVNDHVLSCFRHEEVAALSG